MAVYPPLISLSSPVAGAELRHQENNKTIATSPRVVQIFQRLTDELMACKYAKHPLIRNATKMLAWNSAIDECLPLLSKYPEISKIESFIRGYLEGPLEESDYKEVIAAVDTCLENLTIQADSDRTEQESIPTTESGDSPLSMRSPPYADELASSGEAQEDQRTIEEDEVSATESLSIYSEAEDPQTMLLNGIIAVLESLKSVDHLIRAVEVKKEEGCELKEKSREKVIHFLRSIDTVFHILPALSMDHPFSENMHEQFKLAGSIRNEIYEELKARIGISKADCMMSRADIPTDLQTLQDCVAHLKDWQPHIERLISKAYTPHMDR